MASPSQREFLVTTAYINRIATAVPAHDMHEPFLRFAETLFRCDSGTLTAFKRMAEKSGIDHRYSCLSLTPDWETGTVLDTDALYTRGKFSNTAARMRVFERRAPELATATIERLGIDADRDRITHLIITCCTGFSSPGIDWEVIERCRLPSSIERTIVGFMGCSAAINGLKLARHIVRSEPKARVLVLNLELCTLHFQETVNLAQMLCFLLFADGCAACLVTSEPHGIALDSFRAVAVPDSRGLMAWNIRDLGFDMVLSGKVPRAIHDALRGGSDEILLSAPISSIDLWAVHPGGHSILDAVERAFDLGPEALRASREVLRRYGNMSSATVMFVLEELMRSATQGARGCAMSFGPGLIAETMLFHAVRDGPSHRSFEKMAEHSPALLAT
jgi:predicted naringenin-chalcone synthase